MSTYYVYFDANVSGTGTSSRPYDSEQFFDINYLGLPLSAGVNVSAVSGDTFKLKGTSITTYGNEYLGYYGFNYESWENGEPYKISATNEASYITFGEYGTTATSVVKVEDGIFSTLALNPVTTNYDDLYKTSAISGTYYLNNNIVYNEFRGQNLINWSINANGCTFVSANCYFTERYGNISDRAVSFLAVSGSGKSRHLKWRWDYINPRSGFKIYQNTNLIKPVNFSATVDYYQRSYSATGLSAVANYYWWVDGYSDYLEANNIAIFNDCLFINSNISDLGTNYGTFRFNYCEFTNTIAEVSARLSSTYNDGGDVIFNHCTFDRELPINFPTFQNLIINQSHASLKNITYDNPYTSATRSSAWINGDYTEGFWNSVRSGPGAFNFQTIVNTSVYTSALNLLFNSNIPVITGNILIYPTTLHTISKIRQPQVYGFVDISAEFVGVPVVGASSLIVNFTAKVITTSLLSGQYEVLGYRWYFDYDRYPTVYTTTIVPTATHTYTGYSGKKYSVKCSAIVRLL